MAGNDYPFNRVISITKEDRRSKSVVILNEFINQSGVQQWNNLKMISSVAVVDAIKKYDEVKPLL